MPPALRDPLSIAAYFPASGCMIAEPMPPTTINAPNSQSEEIVPAAEMHSVVANTAAGRNHQRPCLSEYAPANGCTIELARYQTKTNAP